MELLGKGICMRVAKSKRLKINFNDDWKFYMEDIPNVQQLGFQDGSWETVILPHTPKIEALDVCMHFQGICWYRKEFEVSSEFKHKKLFIEFEAAMHTAEVWINGKYKTTHKGGYLPFLIDISDDIYFDRENVIAVRLDNRDNYNIPPGRPLEKLDFCYFGGLYRNVYMHVTDKLYITNPIHADKIAGGGIFVTYPFVSRESANVKINTHVINEYDTNKEVSVITYLVDIEGNTVVASESGLQRLASSHDHTFIQELTVHNPILWDPDDPYLYKVHSFVKVEQQIVDEIETKIGIRKIEFQKPEGFIINGKPLRLRGVNRHQQYPYIGNAASDNAQYRDAKKIKEAGFNFIRLGHYPQSPAFLDACDELGLMVVEPTPGWQWCKEGEFQELVKQNIRDMIRRDRNHPCVIMWETSLNETGTYWEGASDEFYHECNMIAHEEYPTDQMFTSGDTMGRNNPQLVNYDVPYTQWDEETKSRPLDKLPYKMGLDREYGDFEFGGAYSTTRRRRGDGERALLNQAWNFQWSHNRNRRNEWSIGDAIWVGIDYNRGCGIDDPRPTCDAGILDMFRLPKFSYYFYQSQRNPNIKHSDISSGPMVYIANYWTEDSQTDKVIVYSNCEEVKLYVNNRLVTTKKSDDGPDAEYISQGNDVTVDYWLKGKDIPKKENGEELDDPLALFSINTQFDGGNCRHIEHAPFTFEGLPYEPGELKAVGLIGGREVAVDIRKTPKAPKELSIKFDTCGKELIADGSDFIFVYAQVIDENGTVVPHAQHKIKFELEGPGQLIGKNPIKAEAGIASILLKSTKDPGKILVTGQSNGLKIGWGEIESESPNP